MSYTLNQYNQAFKEPQGTTTNDFMTPLISGEATRRQNASDSGISGATSLAPFYDECINFQTSLNTEDTYYLHAKIKRLKSEQVFYIYLVNNGNASGTDKNKTQFIKQIVVQPGDLKEWVDLELVFRPLLSFNAMVFQLQRNIDDVSVTPIIDPTTGEVTYSRVGTRYPVIVYQEFSKIKNIISSKLQVPNGILKFGAQSHPGLMMCINGEEIHIGRSGTYEFKNGLILINFFSVIIAADEWYGQFNSLKHPVTGVPITLEDLLDYLAGLPDETDTNKTNSLCIFSTTKQRKTDAFTIDYMYEEA